MFVHGYHPSLPGWNLEWETRWEDEYGYDPEAAKELPRPGRLSRRVQDEDVRFPYPARSARNCPTLPKRSASTGPKSALMWKSSVWNFPRLDPSSAPSNSKVSRPPSEQCAGPIQEQVRIFNATEAGVVHQYETDSLQANWEELTKTLDATERDRLIREIGNEKFDNFENIPLLWIFFQVAIDPDIIAEYKFPGTAASNFSHLETITAVKQ